MQVHAPGSPARLRCPATLQRKCLHMSSHPCMPKLPLRISPVPLRCRLRKLVAVHGSRGRLDAPERSSVDVGESLEGDVDGPEPPESGNSANGANGTWAYDDDAYTAPDKIDANPAEGLLALLGEKLSSFELPFNYFIPFLIMGLVASVIGVAQSFVANPTLDAFSPDQLLHFQLPVQTAVFLAVFLQAVAGWGFALGAITGVALLGPGLTVKDAQAFVAVIAVAVDGGMFLPYLQTKSLDRKVVDPWVVGATLGTPLGVLALRYVDEQEALFALGLTTLAYCTYSAYNIIECYYSAGMGRNNNKEATNPDACKLPPDRYPALGTWLSGAFAGVLGGAFDAPGPPLVVFADLTGMANVPDLMKANLLAFFALDSQLVAVSDLLDDRFMEPFIWPSALLAMPTAIVANAIGKLCSKHIDQEKFRWVVLALLAGCGLHQMRII
ncbi:unnamed protein product [Ostreobium quekettii]|uniref:Uncharacterized protein n=1 Tax=Ostreobium quekettii TaxID=121088 RepID=A0A8S1IU91_9CHLO|nr:unnamed protein product [Ostreobium quekettii]|eukprot:evm.model.scf_779.1 EVM.evm.TU.scf_779.1   scf_779:3559-4881(-)